MKTKICVVCGKKFVKNKNVCKKQWLKTKYCSSKCANIAWRGHPAPKSAFKKGHIPWNKGNGIKLNNCLDKWRNNGGGIRETHPGWKGEKAKYAAIHMWVRKHKKKPKNCSNCGKKGNAYQIHWSNIDHKYKRNLDDYIALCVSCHKRHDLDSGLYQH